MNKHFPLRQPLNVEAGDELPSPMEEDTERGGEVNEKVQGADEPINDEVVAQPECSTS